MIAFLFVAKNKIERVEKSAVTCLKFKKNEYLFSGY